jgi:hypothetical protein
MQSHLLSWSLICIWLLLLLLVYSKTSLIKQPRTSQPDFQMINMKHHPGENQVLQDEFLPLKVCVCVCVCVCVGVCVCV